MTFNDKDFEGIIGIHGRESARMQEKFLPARTYEQFMETEAVLIQMVRELRKDNQMLINTMEIEREK